MSDYNIMIRIKKEMLLNYSYTGSTPFNSLGWKKREILRDLLHFDIYGVHPTLAKTSYVLQNGSVVGARGFKLVHPHQKILYATTTPTNLKCALTQYKTTPQRMKEVGMHKEDPHSKVEHFIFNEENIDDLCITSNFKKDGFLLRSSFLKTDIINALKFYKMWGEEERIENDSH